MNEKYLIGYDPNRLNNSFSYVSLMNMMQKLTQDGLDYTFDKDGYYTSRPIICSYLRLPSLFTRRWIIFMSFPKVRLLS
jgi:hypothetical protein